MNLEQVSMLLEFVPAEFRDMVRELFNGPDEVRALLLRAAEFREQPEPPPGWDEALRGLRPLSRKFIVRTFDRHGLLIEDNEHTRALKFFD